MFELLLRNHRSNHLHLNKIIFNQYKNRKYLQKKKYIVESLKKILIQIFLLINPQEFQALMKRISNSNQPILIYNLVINRIKNFYYNQNLQTKYKMLEKIQIKLMKILVKMKFKTKAISKINNKNHMKINLRTNCSKQLKMLKK